MASNLEKIIAQNRSLPAEEISDIFKTELYNEFENLQLNKQQKKNLSKILSKLTEEIVIVLDEINLTEPPENQIKKIMNLIKLQMPKIPELSKVYANLDKLIKPLIIPLQYKKDEIVNNLRLLLENANEKEAKKIVKAIKTINQSPGNYIDATFLEPLKVFSFRWQSNLTPYLSLDDFAIHNSSQWLGKKVLEDLSTARLASEPGIAFKIGQENLREILAMKLMQDLNLNKYLILKTEVKLPKAQIGNTKAPAGIIGRWVTGGGNFLGWIGIVIGVHIMS